MDKESKQKLGMVDVGSKDITVRTAIATATVRLSQKAFDLLLNDKSPKGDVFETAKIAGILAAKSTPSIIPLCHPLELSKARVTFENNMEDFSIVIKSEVSYVGRTGVEMEALTAASAAALTIYDMMKWADKGIVVSDVQLLEKTGGKSGDYHRSK